MNKPIRYRNEHCVSLLLRCVMDPSCAGSGAALNPIPHPELG
jgi:hypothetical protein